MQAKRAGKRKRKDNENNEEESDNEVEAILQERMTRRGKQYLLKCKGKTDRHNSWRYEEDMQCDNLLRDWERRKKARKR
jgi:hypothetical protein